MSSLKEFQTRIMHETIELSRQGMTELCGGPFAAIIVKDGQVIAKGVNQVTSSCDPTAHAEIVAIREASKKLQNFDLQGCEIYCSCEPCPMCLAAIYWARIDKIYYANSREDAAAIDFDDAWIYKEVCLDPSQREISMERLLGDEAKKVFQEWQSLEDKTPY